MRAVAAVAAVAALACSGCFASWVTVQATGTQKILDEGVHESAVPLPGPREELHVTLPTQLDVTPPPAQANGAPGSGPGTPKPFALVCEVTQHGQDTVYHAAFRYGHTWKWAAAIFFVVEASTAALIYASNTGDAGTVATAGVLALDALGTGVLAFAPRKEIYRVEPRADDTVVRQDCPDGLALVVGGQPFPIDAAGRVGELGNTAVDDWMRMPTAPLRVTLGGQDEELPISGDEQCSWNASHHGAVCQRHLAGLAASVTLAVPLGTLTRAE